MKSQPDEDQPVTLNTQELEAKLDEIERVMGAETAQPFRWLLGWVLRLQQLIEARNVTISRLRKMIFGASTEHTRHVEARQDPQAAAGEETAAAEDARPSEDGG